MVHLIPGDPAEYLMRGFGSEEEKEQLREDLGLNRPLHVQYWDFITGVVTGDFGRSFISNKPVLEEISGRFYKTIELTAATMLVAVTLGINIGIISATRRHTIFDDAARLLALVGISVPSFWLGLMLMFVFAFKLGWFPALGRGGPIWTLQGLWHIALPALSLGAQTSAILARLVRSSMLDVLNKDYIRTARAKGLSGRVVIYRHALANALIPVITVIGLQTGVLLGGAIVTETIFAWPGLGRMTIDAILKRDFPLVQGTVVVFALCFVMVNLAVDVLYGLIDPRIRYQ
jgi:ABC-type dipeptide/oligopeptide/nickel transport system permease component